MMPTRQTIPLEHDYIQAETSMLQLQLPHDDLDTNQAVEHASDIVEDLRVSSGPMPASDSLLPNIQIPNSVNGHTIISALSQPYFGTLGNIGDDAAQQSEPGPTGAPTVLPVTTTNQQALSYSENIWDIHKPKIRQLYIEENRKLSEVMRQMQEDEGFRPSVSMYKAHLSKWALYKRNRKQDVIAMLSLKQIRDSAGKSSTIFRSGKQVNMQKLYSYLRRKRLDTRAFEGVESDDMIRMAGHIYARTPSPLSMASNLVSTPGSLGFKETILRSINRGYTYWISERAEVTSPMPDIFHSAQIRSLNSIDIVSLLLQHGLKLFQQSRFSKGGSYVRAAFIFIEFHIEGLSKFVRRDEQPLSWIFGLWALLTSGLPSELSKMLLAHFMKLSRAYFPEMHPMSEILRCLFNAHKEGHENFLSFIFSTWADAINALRALLQTSGLDAEVCLPHNLYMGDINGHFQFQDDISEFRRTETIESWQQRVKELSFVLCNNRQLYRPSPSHTHVLTLMWLRRSLVKAVDATRSSHRYVQGYTQQVDSKNFLVKTASVTRLELSVGRRDHSSESEDIRVLSGDVYQVRYLHGPRPGEDSDTFMGKHNLDTHNFEILKNKCRATSGIETDKATWLRWLQILEESLIGPWERRQRLESVVLHQDLRGKGLICTSISTKDGEVGIRKMAKKEENPESSLDTGWMLIDEALFQN